MARASWRFSSADRVATDRSPAKTMVVLGPRFCPLSRSIAAKFCIPDKLALLSLIHYYCGTVNWLLHAAWPLRQPGSRPTGHVSYHPSGCVPPDIEYSAKQSIQCATRGGGGACANTPNSGRFVHGSPSNTAHHHRVLSSEICRPLLPHARAGPRREVYSAIALEVDSNHGEENYTCIYRFRVHGNPAP